MRQLRHLSDLEHAHNHLTNAFLQVLLEVTGEACVKRIVYCFEHWVLQADGALHKGEGSGQISQADVAPLRLLLNQISYLQVEV
jgi:hypothetical protein